MDQLAQSAYSAELRHLLNTNHPAQVLRLLPEEPAVELLVYKCEALIELDQSQTALSLLGKNIQRLSGEAQLHGRLMQAQGLIKAGLYDPAILIAAQTARLAGNQDQIAEALALTAIGYACKRCWNLSESNIRNALSTAPAHPRVLVAHGRILLEADQRLEARSVFERLEVLPIPWAKAYAGWGQSYVAYLVGEFDRSLELARMALDKAEEIIFPRLVIAQVALARNDLEGLEQILSEIRMYSPLAESLAWFQGESEKLAQRIKNSSQNKHLRLAAFPTLIQRRNYCGPSTIELILRYWKGGLEMTNEQIAERVKYSQGGTPIYRMREFFHLVGFDTIRCQASIPVIQKLLEAGFPIIIQEEYASSSHVAVIIGYDPEHKTVELQDPMTHTIETMPVDKVNHLRSNFLDSALIAFPRGHGHEKMLARMNIFVDQALTWSDQAILEIDQGRYQAAADLMENAVRRKPELALAWMLLLHAYLEQWQQSCQFQNPKEIDVNVDASTARTLFYGALKRAHEYHSGAKFVYQFQGWGALIDQNFLLGIEAFHQACAIDEEDALNYASLAECHFAIREYEGASETALESLRRDTSLPSANLWLARSLVVQQGDNAEHYARSAEDLDPHNWLVHIALAEVAINEGDLKLARQEVNQAILLAPNNPEVLLLRGILLAAEGETKLAAEQLLEILEQSQTLSPSVLYRTLQYVGKQSLTLGEYNQALAHAQRILDHFPQDPWGLQFFAVAYCENLLTSEKELSPPAIDDLMSLYEKAIVANQGDASLIKDYVTYLEALAGSTLTLQATIRLCNLFPENRYLLFLIGRLNCHLGEDAAAAESMLLAINEDGIHTREEFREAINTILMASGVRATNQNLLPLLQGIDTSDLDRLRNLGLTLATFPELDGTLARELLMQVFKLNPQDAEVVLTLGNLVHSEEDRENLYRQALMISPGWPQARANLASYLVERGRALEALEFTRGYQYESIELLTMHGQALLRAGHYEEAIEIFDQAVQKLEDPDSWLLASRWQAELRSGLYERSLRTAQDGLQMFPEETQWHLYTAESLRSLQRYAEADRMIRIGMKKGLSETDILHAHIEIAIDRRDSELALSLLDELLVIEDKQDDGRLSWAEAQRMRLLVETGRGEDALNFLHLENLGSEGWGEAAWMALMGNNPELAIVMSQHALNIDPHNYSGMVTFAQALAERGQEAEALAAWYDLKNIYPNEHDAYEKLAIRLTLDGKANQGAAFAEQAVNLGQYCPFSWVTRGTIMFLNGQTENAYQDLRTAWNRMDLQNRNQANLFWFILAYLEQDEEHMMSYGEMAHLQATTPFQKRLLAAVEARMAH